MRTESWEELGLLSTHSPALRHDALAKARAATEAGARNDWESAVTLRRQAAEAWLELSQFEIQALEARERRLGRDPNSSAGDAISFAAAEAAEHYLRASEDLSSDFGSNRSLDALSTLNRAARTMVHAARMHHAYGSDAEHDTRYERYVAAARISARAAIGNGSGDAQMRHLRTGIEMAAQAADVARQAGNAVNTEAARALHRELSTEYQVLRSRAR